MKPNIAIGFSDYFLNYYNDFRNNSNYVELYLDYDQWKENKDKIPSDLKINLLFNIIPNKTDFIKNWKENLKIVESVNPDYITTSSYSFGRVLAEDGWNVEASVVNTIDSIDKVYELSKLNYKGYTLSHDKIYDFKMMEEIKKYFPEIRMKVIPNMMCSQCIMYTERHECFYFNNDTENLSNTRIDYHCNKNPLTSSIAWPGIIHKYKHVDVFKFASRKNDEFIYKAILAFLKNDDKEYLSNMFNFYFRQFSYNMDSLVDFFINEKKLCNFKCFICSNDCGGKFKLWSQN